MGSSPIWTAIINETMLASFFYDLTRIYTKLVLCIIVHINYSDLDPVSLADMNVEKVITKELGLS